MDWIEQLQEHLQASATVQLSIDGQIWTVEQQNGSYRFTNRLGRQEHFRSEEELISALQSWYENPVTVVL
ncbi:hypothetical protein EV586_107122 [Tumebacillus sp. BK434]|uniref:hypothetical protein n=1 Tax=Tumebacillus sp. BK434 TaxID=2512169 RepID=UPI001043B573|nr:hypothetical protein [Tumebacillus sp. BK434]TCP52879.1 hypothetical protein EV586_107122 [Tumebacillus sp. BK434]